MGLVLVVLAGLRVDRIDIDPPDPVVYGYTGQAHYRDEVAKAHEARNKALWDQWSLSEFDDYGFWRAQSPSWVWGETWWFRAFGVGFVQARLFVIIQTMIALALLAWLVLVRHGAPAAFAAVGLLGFNWAYLVYSRLALMEGALICWLMVATVMISQLEREPRRAGLWAMLATLAMLVACTIKQTGLLLVPPFVVALVVLGLRAAGTIAGLDDADAPWHLRLRARLRGRAAQSCLLAVATLAVVLALIVFNPEYQQRLAFNAEHFTAARDESIWVRAAATLVRGFFSFRLQLMFTRLAPLILWLATLELARQLIGLARARRARKRGQPPPPIRGALEGAADPIDWWMLAWAILALLANLASPHRAIRFQLVLLPPAAWLAGALVGRAWRHEWSRPRLRAATRAGFVVLAALGLTLTSMRYVEWRQTRGASTAHLDDELEALIGEREAVVVGAFAAQAVFETRYRHFYVRSNQFNFSPEILRALDITHLVISNQEDDRIFNLIADGAPELLVGRRKLGTIKFRRRNLEVWELASEERRAEIETWQGAELLRRKREKARDARIEREYEAQLGRDQKQMQQCLSEPLPVDKPAMTMPRPLREFGARGRPKPGARPPR